MKFNRILSSALLVVMIFMTCVAVLPITASAAYSSETSGSANLSVQEIAKVVQDSYKQYYTKEPPLNYVNPPLYASASEKLQAEIAAGYSRASGDQVAVDYTRVKFIKKPAGSKPGFVTYKTNYTAFVKPRKSLD